MDKRIIAGLVSGLIFGVLELLLFGGGFGGGNYQWLILPAILGAVIGWASSMKIGLNFYLLSAIVGALFFMVIAFGTGNWLDDIATGAITGALIGVIIQFVGNKAVS